MKMQQSPGTRDFLPEQQILRQEIISTLRTYFERFGFSPLDTPGIERFEVLASKYAGGSEILKETFNFRDQGKRHLALRYDLTVPLARVLAMNKDIRLPFKRYHIDKVWRDGPVEAGRYREFMQCDVDAVGSRSMAVEAEIIQLIQKVFSQLGLECKVKVNNRKVLNGILRKCGVNSEKHDETLIALDKLAKTGRANVEKELKRAGMSAGQVKELFGLLETGSSEQSLSRLDQNIDNEEGGQGAEELRQLFSLLSSRDNVELDFSLARGLNYYTGTIIETFLQQSSVTSSVCAGGRYDKMIGDFIGAGAGYPACGVSFGLDRIYDALLEKRKTSAKTMVQVFVIPIQSLDKCLAIAGRLRENGINTDVDVMERSISKNLSFAHQQGIPFALMLGPRETEEGKVKLRNMKTGKEEVLTIEQAIARIKDEL